MSRSRLAIVLAFVASLTIWGCSQHPPRPSAAKAVRMQQQIDNLTILRDRLRRDLERVQADNDLLRAEVARLQPVVQQRDQLERPLEQRTEERDRILGQLEHFREEVRGLLDQVEAAVRDMPTTVETAATAAR